MKLQLTLLAAAAFAIGTLNTQAAPEDFVGKPLPASSLKFVEKAPEAKGKPQIVEFWATWCGPCKQTIPHLNEMHKKYKDKGLVIIGVTNEDKATIKKFQKTLPMDYAVATDTGGKLSTKLGIKSIPQAFILDKDGKVTWQGNAGSLTEAEIEKVLQ